MLKPGGTGGDQYEVDANGNIVPRKSNSKNYYSVEWKDGVPSQVSHPVGPRVTPPVWDANAQQADDAASQQWQNYITSLPGFSNGFKPTTPTPAPATPAAPQVNTAASLLTGTNAAANPAPQPVAALGRQAMQRQLSPSTMVQMNSPLNNGLWGYNLWSHKK